MTLWYKVIDLISSYVPMKRGRKKQDPFNGGRKVKKLLSSRLEVSPAPAMQFCSFYLFFNLLGSSGKTEEEKTLRRDFYPLSHSSPKLLDLLDEIMFVIVF